MPHPPKPFKAVVVHNAPTHVVNHIDAIELGPSSMKSPNYQKFVPNEDQMKQSDQFDLDQRCFMRKVHDWKEVLIKFKRDEQQDEFEYFWTFR